VALRAPLVLALLVAVTLAGGARGQEGGGPQAPLAPAVVAVIDYQRLLRESAAARSIRAQVETQRQAYEAEVEAERERLAEADRRLNDARDELSAEAYRERRRAFEQDVAAVQRLVQQRRRQLDEASSTAFQRIRDTVVQIIDALSDRYRFNLVLPRAEVLVFAPEIDLTAEVMAELDERLPRVDIPAFED
jgi:Skp family chaperone for outer membrane proteins